jgi:hypothetical protein
MKNKDAIETKLKRVNFRFTAADMAKLQALSASSGKNHSELIRDLLHGRPIPTQRTPIETEFLGCISRLGSNLNQVNRMLNSAQSGQDPDLILKQKQTLDELRDYMEIIKLTLVGDSK